MLKMGIKLLLVSLMLSVSALSGCASIVHNGPREVSIASEPPGAKVSIYNRGNVLVSTNTTPFVAQLEPKYGYFKGEAYRLVFEKDGFVPSEALLKSEVSGWYFGNLVFGGLIGMLAVDPATGAMFNIVPTKVQHSLSASAPTAADSSAASITGSTN
jgi:hypothetical protein